MKYAYEITRPFMDQVAAQRELARLRKLDGFLSGRILPGRPPEVRAFFEARLKRDFGKPMEPETWDLPTGVQLIKIPTLLEAVLL